ANSPIVTGDVQPQVEPSLTGTSSATSQPPRSTAPVQSTVPGARIGDSGTKISVPTAAATTPPSGIQNSQWYESASGNGPARTNRGPAPIPSSAEISAIPCGTRARGNSSRMIANASGKIAPPAPWITRPRIITWIDVARPATTVPTASTTRTTTSVRFLPN